jgi:hypothetical protein
MKHSVRVGVVEIERPATGDQTTEAGQKIETLGADVSCLEDKDIIIERR